MKKLFKILVLFVCLITPTMVNAQESAKEFYEMGKEMLTSEDADDIKLGLVYVIAAAEDGHCEAQLLAGTVLLLLEDEELSEKAVGYLKKAAAQNNKDAMKLLSLCYESGTGVTANKQLASYWSIRAEE